jgi:hypothetical protein
MALHKAFSRRFYYLGFVASMRCPFCPTEQRPQPLARMLQRLDVRVS